MKTSAALLVETGKPLVVVELDIPALKPGQVLVEMAHSGVCHTNLLEARGHRGRDPFLPHCLGHEGSGTVREAGSGVSKVRPGDGVIVSWMKGSGADAAGTTYRWNGRVVNAGAVTTFGCYSVISENRLTRLPPGVALPEAALLGCAAPTGLGAVFNAAKPRPGQSLVVLGTGGVGLCAVAAARLAGCEPIVAMDPRKDRLAAACAMGATRALRAGQQALEALLGACPGGADFAVEASGRPEVMRLALAAVRPRGGSVVVIGNARQGELLELDPREFNLGKRLLGTWGGDNEPDRDFPRYGELVRARELDLSALLAARYPLARVNDALADLEEGRVLRPMLDLAA